MQESRAPIYVVVKSFAASMAAVVTAMAERSYVYPNAIILHTSDGRHELGNVTQLKEQLELARDWERRMYAPVAKKMGLSLETCARRCTRRTRTATGRSSATGGLVRLGDELGQ